MSKNGAIILAALIVVVIVGAGIYFAGTLNQGSPPESVPAPAPAGIQPTSPHMITLQTSMGDITFETYDNDAPNTVKNFITLAEKGFYNNVIFHRVIKGFM